jgi:hypothetical protein
MATDPNIALGIRPVEQVNMLGQMGQMMQLRQMKQEYEGSEGVNELSRQGIKDPYAYLQYGKPGRATYESILKGQKDLREGQKLEVDLGIAKIGAFRDQLNANVNDPAAAAKWLTAVNNDPLVGKVLSSVPLQDQIAGIPSDPKGFADWKNRTMLKAPDFVKHFVESADAKLSSGPAYLQAGIARERLTMEQAEQANIARILRGESPVPTGGAPVVPMAGGGGGGGVAPMSSGGVAPVAPPTRGTAPVVAPMSNVAPIGSTPMPVATAVRPNVNGLNVNPAAPITPNVNALTADAIPPEIAQIQTKISQLISSGSPKAIAAADALIKQHNLLMPTRQIVQNTKGEYNAVDQRTSVSTPVLDAAGKQLVGKLPPEQFESEYKKIVGKSAAERDVALVTNATAARESLPKLYETLDQIKTSDAITGFGANMITKIEAARAKFAGDIKAGKKVADTEILDAMLGSDVFPMIQSLGIGAKGLDTPAEREYLRAVMTGTITMNKDALIKLTEIRKNVAERAIELYNIAGTEGKLNKFFDTQGDKFEYMYAPTYTPKTTTPQSGGEGVKVSLPDGRSVTLPNAEAAAKFKKDAGIK